MNNELILVGGGGHCKSCIDVIEQQGDFSIHGVLDSEAMVGENVLGYPIVGTDVDFNHFIDEGFFFLVTVGQIKTFSTRKRLFDALLMREAKMATVVSPRAYVSKHADIGQGTIIMHDALVNADSDIGRNCIVNSKALVEHDVVIKDHCHVATAAVVNGGVVLKEGSFYGSNAVSKEYVQSAPGCFIKAGSVFTGER